METNEFIIPVPWGHIAVKSWGNEQNTPVIVSHGLQDNLGIFDNFIPLLPNSFYYICIDLPGHGKSSHCSSISFMNAYDTLITFKLVVDHFKRHKYIFLCHSWSGQCAVLFAQLYPEYLLKLIVLDSYYLFPVSIKHFKDKTISIIDHLIRINDAICKNKQPSYTYEEAIEKIIVHRQFGEISRKTADNLLKRCLIKDANGKYIFTIDPKVKTFARFDFSIEDMIALVRQYPIQCPKLFVMASFSKNIVQKFLPIVEEMKKYSPCKIVELSGSHTDFSNEPEIWAPVVIDFLTHVECKL